MKGNAGIMVIGFLLLMLMLLSTALAKFNLPLLSWFSGNPVIWVISIGLIAFAFLGSLLLAGLAAGLSWLLLLISGGS